MICSRFEGTVLFVCIEGTVLSKKRTVPLVPISITAHQAFLTREALEQIAATTLQNISDFEKGEINKKKSGRNGEFAVKSDIDLLLKRIF
jgi:lactate dehydrogenase-like 2-hydroxyacid dehydrogenase